MEGELIQTVIEKPENGRDEVFLESLFALRGNPLQEGIRSERWKYIRYHRPERQAEQLAKGHASFHYNDADPRFETEAIYEQLFDLNNDPVETRNLANPPSMRSLRVG